jgi:hypothetical protein
MRLSNFLCQIKAPTTTARCESELKNLADDPAQKARVAQLKAQLEKHVQEAGGE